MILFVLFLQISLVLNDSLILPMVGRKSYFTIDGLLTNDFKSSVKSGKSTIDI